MFVRTCGASPNSCRCVLNPASTQPLDKTHKSTGSWSWPLLVDPPKSTFFHGLPQQKRGIGSVAPFFLSKREGSFRSSQFYSSLPTSAYQRANDPDKTCESTQTKVLPRKAAYEDGFGYPGFPLYRTPVRGTWTRRMPSICGPRRRFVEGPQALRREDGAGALDDGQLHLRVMDICGVGG